MTERQMHDDEVMARTVARWLHGTADAIVASPSGHDRLLADVADTPQRSHRWLPQIPSSRFQTMFSATKFVVAGAIVALFGGFLLTGVPTRQGEEAAPIVGASASAAVDATAPTRSPSPEGLLTTELLPGVVFETELVRRGLFRIVSDGAGHDLGQAEAIVIAQDGTVWATEKWNVDRNRQLYRVGEAGFVPDKPMKQGTDLAVAPDGTIWFGSDDGFVSYDGEAWSRIGEGSYAGLTASPDGSIWALHDLQVVNLKDGVVTTSPRADGLEDVIVDWADEPLGDVLTTLGGEAWLWGGGWDERAGTDDPDLRLSGGLLHFDGERWRSHEPLGSGQQFTVHSLVADPDGTAWALVDIGSPYLHGAASRDRRLIAHFDGKRWSRMSDRRALRAIPRGPELVFLKEVVHIDENGYPIIRYESRDLDAEGNGYGGGWLAFDGKVWSQVDRIARTYLFTTPGGDVWERGGNGRVFVTRPQAAWASEPAP